MLDAYVPSELQEPPNPIDEGQRALWCAVMEQAVNDFRGRPDQVDKDSAHHKRLRFEEAERWFKSTSRRVNSFLSLCDLLGLDPARIRQKLFAEKKTLQKPWRI